MTRLQKAKSRWARLRAVLKPLWWSDFQTYSTHHPEKIKKITKYMRSLINKQILVPDKKGGRLVKVLGIELTTPKYSYGTIFTCLVSGIMDDGQLIRFHFRGCVVPEPYNQDNDYVGIHAWRATTPKLRALLLAQELEQHA